MNVIKEIQRINADELKRGVVGGGPGSWHEQYKDSSYVYAGGLPYDLTEGDILCMFSQWGEIEDINLVRDEGTGKSKGFAFVKYEDQRSTVLAVDNFTGATLLGRMLRVDHVLRYKLPKHLQDKEDEADEASAVDSGHYGPVQGENDEGSKYKPGHAYKGKDLANEYNIAQGVDLYAKPEAPKASAPVGESESESDDSEEAGRGEGLGKRKRSSKKKEKKEKGSKKEKKGRKKEHKKEKKLSKVAGGDFSMGQHRDTLPLPPPVNIMGSDAAVIAAEGADDDAWKGRFAGSGGGAGGGGGAGTMLQGQYIGGFGGSGGGKGAKLMGPKFGGGSRGKGNSGTGSAPGKDGGSSGNACYTCGKEGHRSAECPSGKGSSSRGGGGDRSYGGSHRLR